MECVVDVVEFQAGRSHIGWDLNCGTIDLDAEKSDLANELELN